MKLSILILTHNRPVLFSRCLQSVLARLPKDVEVIVNNDSNDITEVWHPQVKYHYYKFDSLCEIYQHLLMEAKGDYVYYLEDDDYLNNSFFDIPLDFDLTVGNYCPTYDPNNLLEYMAHYKESILSPTDFLNAIDFEKLQLSQHIFKRTSILGFDFKKDNNVHNDIRLVLYAASRTQRIRTTSTILFYQTKDGGDNISFPDTIPSVNTTQSLDFLEDHGIQTPTSYRPRP